MFTMAHLKECMSADEIAYVERKRRGGDAAMDGRHFEVIVALTNVVQAIADWFDADLEGDSGYIEEQTLGYVDDLMVVPTGRREPTFIQVKKGAIDWRGGERPLLTDFQLQVKLCRHHRIAANLELAIAYGVRTNTQPPIELPRYQFRRYATSVLPDRVADHPELVKGLHRSASRYSDVTLRNQIIALKSAWDTLDGRGSGEEFLLEASRAAPTSFASLQWFPEIDATEWDLLESIPGVSFDLTGGTLQFWENDCDRNRITIDIADHSSWKALMTAWSDAPPQDFIELCLLTSSYM